MTYHIAVDIGASSGRLILADVEERKWQLQEIHRFKNGFTRVDQHDRWDVEELFRQILVGLEKAKELGVGNCTLGIDTWAVDYVLALIIGVFFQYAGLASMSHDRGLSLWFRAFKVDFLSLTAWQVGMYGWMAIAVFLLVGPMSPDQPVFWLMMQISMICGFITAYPMNWWLIRIGIKSAM